MWASIALVMAGRPACLVLVDNCGALAVVSHPGHQILEARAASCREMVPGVPEIVKVEAFGADRPDGVWPGRILLKLLRRSGPPLTPGKMSASASGLTKRERCSRTAGMIHEGMPTRRRPALDFGGPTTAHLRPYRSPASRTLGTTPLFGGESLNFTGMIFDAGDLQAMRGSPVAEAELGRRAVHRGCSILVTRSQRVALASATVPHRLRRIIIPGR